MSNVLLYEELKLIERDDADINNAWKGVHLLLFFMAFVFGSFCTFSFHMLMYLFDKKCVLYPKLLWLTSLPHDIIYEFIPVDKEIVKMLPVDFVSTQWMEKSVCYLPTYVPLMSGIFGIIWTTMFLVCYTSAGTLEGSRRSWRVLLPIFLFSVAMSGLCIYSSTITHQGLEELCVKLGEITGSSTCTYTVNVATLAYERSIRGVYQAIQLTITSAWLHTSCWIMSAALIIIRVVLLIDFQLVRVTVELKGDLDKMLQQYEEQMRTVSPNAWPEEKLSESQSEIKTELTAKPKNMTETTDTTQSTTERPSDDLKYHYKNTKFTEATHSNADDDENFIFIIDSETEKQRKPQDTFFFPFIKDLINDLVFSVTEVVQEHIELTSSDDIMARNFRFQRPLDSFVQEEDEKIARRLLERGLRPLDVEIQHHENNIENLMEKQYESYPISHAAPNIEDMPSTSKGQYERRESSDKKSNLKSVSTQSDLIKPKSKGTKVQIQEGAIILCETENKSTQTSENEKK